MRYGVDSVRTPTIRRGVTAEVIEALRQADGLVISGGGNISGMWPDKVDERIALLKIARDLGRPVVVVGQTLGPTLSLDQSARLAHVLPWAEWVGVRDEESGAVARSLGVPADRVHRQLDACVLPGTAAGGQRAGRAPSPRESSARPRDVGRFVRRRRPPRSVASDCQSARRRGGLARRGAVVRSSCRAARRCRTHIAISSPAARSPPACVRRCTSLDLWQPREVRWLVAQAAMVVSTRYHPIVFATAAGYAGAGPSPGRVHAHQVTRARWRA